MSRIAFVIADSFEDSEFETPHTTLLEHGHEVDVISIDAEDVTGKNGAVAPVSMAIGDADVSDYDALVIPGGYAPDKLRVNADVVSFVRAAVEAGMLTAAVCHAPSLLIEAGVVEGRTMTSWPSIRTDLENAGAKVVDEEVVVDQNIITSRNPDDLQAFTKAILDGLGDLDPGEVVKDS